MKRPGFVVRATPAELAQLDAAAALTGESREAWARRVLALAAGQALGVRAARVCEPPARKLALSALPVKLAPVGAQAYALAGYERLTKMFRADEVLASAYKAGIDAAPRFLKHAVARNAFTAGRVTRIAGEALCKRTLSVCGVVDLHLSQVDCPRCVAMLQRMSAALA